MWFLLKRSTQLFESCYKFFNIVFNLIHRGKKNIVISYELWFRLEIIGAFVNAENYKWWTWIIHEKEKWRTGTIKQLSLSLKATTYLINIYLLIVHFENSALWLLSRQVFFSNLHFWKSNSSPSIYYWRVNMNILHTNCQNHVNLIIVTFFLEVTEV